MLVMRLLMSTTQTILMNVSHSPLLLASSSCAFEDDHREALDQYKTLGIVENIPYRNAVLHSMYSTVPLGIHTTSSSSRILCCEEGHEGCELSACTVRFSQNVRMF